MGAHAATGVEKVLKVLLIN